MDAGGLIVVTQELRKPWFNIGDPVKVDTSLSGAGRVYHADEDPFIDPDTGAYLPEDLKYQMNDYTVRLIDVESNKRELANQRTKLSTKHE